MKHIILPSLFILSAVTFACGQTPGTASAEYTFDDAAEISSWTLQATGDAAKRMPKPKITDGKLYLLESWEKSTAAVALAPPAPGLFRQLDINFEIIMNTGTEGAGFVLLDTAKYGEDNTVPEFSEWEAPSLLRAFGVGFDASDPVNRDPFRGSGNIYDRPQHEISLHWDGYEIIKRVTETEFRDEEPHPVKIHVEFVPGGAEVSLRLDDEIVYDSYFIPSMTVFSGRPVFAARNGETAGDVLVDELKLAATGPMQPAPAPLSITAIDHKINDKDHQRNEAVVQFPVNNDEYARIICTLSLDKPETRFDPWDRIAEVNIFSDDGEKFELLRYITPYHRGYTWKVDVTDFRPLLQGEKKLEQVCGTYGEGWVVTLKFDFYPGKTDRIAYKVINLWSGNPEIGNPDKPVEDFYKPLTVPVAGADYAKVRIVVSGHGMSPNTDNAGEFMPIGRTLKTGDKEFRNKLWKTDNYLNPCRPQGGTWKYDRAGWAPGDIVRPWKIDISDLIKGKDEITLDYDLDPYFNEARGKTWAPTHRTESQLILYKKYPAANTNQDH